MPMDRLTYIMNLALVLPVLLFLPGYVLTRTFLRMPAGILFTEMIFARVFLSVGIASVVGLAAGMGSLFTNQNVVFGVIMVSFVMFLFKKFKLYRRLGEFRLTWDDLISSLLAMGTLLVLLRPSEDIGQSFSWGSELARTGAFQGLRQGPDFSVLGQGPLAAVWYAAVNTFFGLKNSLAALPLLSVLSAGALYFWAMRRFGRIAGVAAALFLATNIVYIWYARYPEGFVLAQSFLLGSFYFADLYFDENRPEFLTASLACLVLSCLARLEMMMGAAFTASWLVFVALVLRNVEKRRLNNPDRRTPGRTIQYPWAMDEKMPPLWIRILLALCAFWALIALSGPRPVLWAVHPAFWLMACAGAALFIWKSARTQDLFFLGAALMYPLISVWQRPGGDWFMPNLGRLIPMAIPAASLFSGLLMGFLSGLGRWAMRSVIAGTLLIASMPLYFQRHFIWTKEYEGIIDFFDGIKRDFLPNDLVFSNDRALAQSFWRLYGVKVYLVEDGYLDEGFQREIRRWLMDGGTAHVLTKGAEPFMSGFKMKLDSVERLRTTALERTVQRPPERMVLHEILVRLYRAVPEEQ